MYGNFPDQPQPYAIIIGLDSMQGLQVARILTQRNVPVIGIAKNQTHYSCRTQVCQAILFTDTANEELIALLEELGPNLSQKAVLFPCQDKNVLIISKYRHRLEAWYHVVLPEPDVVDMMVDKIAFYTYAQQVDLPIPKTFFLYNKADAQLAAQQLNYPAILKPPYRPETWTQHTKQKAFKAANPQELLALYEHYRNWTDVLIAQDWVAGGDANHYSCNCYFDANSEPVVTFVSRKLRQWPPETGQGCLAVSCQNEVVLREALNLYKGLNFRGLGYVEFKYDERFDQYFIIEPNVGRPTGRSALAEASGIEFHYTMYCDAINRPLPVNRQQQNKDVKWIHGLRDLQSALYYWRQGELTLKEWWQSVQGPKVDAVFSWRDPVPFLNAMLSAIPVFFSRRERGIEDYSSRVATAEAKIVQTIDL